MSASSKKKLRSEQYNAKMTERQMAEQKEAKKVKLLTTGFVLVLAAIVVVAAIAGVNQFISNSGIREKNTVALTVGDHEISNAELSYYYMDSINGFFSQYGSYASLLGLDMSKPLDEQVSNEETGDTWADDFLAQAKDNAAVMYALNDAAAAAGYTLEESAKTNMENAIGNMQLNAIMYGYGDLETYLKAIYGKGATEEGYRAYYEMNLLGESYYDHYAKSLTYDDAAIEAADQENPQVYSNYSYNYYNLNTSKFLTGGTTDAEGNTTYSDDEKAAAVAAAKAAAEALTAENISYVEQFNAAIAALDVNVGTTGAVSTEVNEAAYDSVLTVAKDWITDPSRQAGDVEMFENASTTTDADGKEVTDIKGYYVVMFNGIQDNEFALKNVRHILAKFQGGTYDEATGMTNYSDDEKAAAKAKAEEILNTWKSGEATELSFGELAIEKSEDTGSIPSGGLYENVYPNQMVAEFEDWCYDESRIAGDVGIIETSYGYHVMYFVGNSDVTYRQFMIESALRSADASAWYVEITDAVEITDGDTKYIDTSVTMN